MIDILRYHKLSDRDKEGQVLEVYNHGALVVSDGGDAYVDVEHLPIALDKILVVQNWCVLGISLDSPFQAVFGSTFTLNGVKYFTGLVEREHDQSRPEFWYSADSAMTILPGETPKVRVYFNGLPAITNSVTSRIRGWLIPKGNMAQGFGGL